jgi:hypothetical protein
MHFPQIVPAMLHNLGLALPQLQALLVLQLAPHEEALVSALV